MAYINTQGGLIKLVILVIIVLLLLAYFGLNIRSVVNSETFQDNWSFIKTSILYVWDNYLKGPLTYLWNVIFIPLIWNPGISNLQKMADGQPNDIQTSAPVLPNPAGQI